MDSNSTLSLAARIAAAYTDLASTDWRPLGGLDDYHRDNWRSGLGWLEQAIETANAGNWDDTLVNLESAIADLSGLMDSIDGSVLRKLCNAVEDMPDPAYPDLPEEDDEPTPARRYGRRYGVTYDGESGPKDRA